MKPCSLCGKRTEGTVIFRGKKPKHIPVCNLCYLDPKPEKQYKLIKYLEENKR